MHPCYHPSQQWTAIRSLTLSASHRAKRYQRYRKVYRARFSFFFSICFVSRCFCFLFFLLFSFLFDCFPPQIYSLAYHLPCCILPAPLPSLPRLASLLITLCFSSSSLCLFSSSFEYLSFLAVACIVTVDTFTLYSLIFILIYLIFWFWIYEFSISFSISLPDSIARD